MATQTITERETARDLPPSADLESTGATALAEAELRGLLDSAMASRDAAYHHLLECPDDVAQAEVAVGEVQQALAQFLSEVKTAVKNRQPLGYIGQVIAGLASTVAHVAAEVSSHDSEINAKQNKKAYLSKPPVAKPAAKPATIPTKHAVAEAKEPVLVPLPIQQKPKLAFMQVSNVAMGALRPGEAEDDHHFSPAPCSILPKPAAMMTPKESAEQAVEQVRQSMHDGFNKLFGRAPSCLAPLHMSALTPFGLTNPRPSFFGLGAVVELLRQQMPAPVSLPQPKLPSFGGFETVLQVLNAQSIAQAGYSEVPRGHKFEIGELFGPTAQPLGPLLKA
jgi:hypothetical protein